MMGESDDSELRAAVRSHFLHLFGEALTNVKSDQEGNFCDSDGKHPYHGKEELIERMVDGMFKNGFADGLRKFYEENGFYPPSPDLSKLWRFS
jgi:hypothetical protein